MPTIIMLYGLFYKNWAILFDVYMDINSLNIIEK